MPMLLQAGLSLWVVGLLCFKVKESKYTLTLYCVCVREGEGFCLNEARLHSGPALSENCLVLSLS